MSLSIKLPEKLRPIFTTDKKVILLSGGRSSGKTWGIGIFLVLMAIQYMCRILCTRETSAQMDKSSHAVISDTIGRMGLDSQFNITKKDILCYKTDATVGFMGLLGNTKLQTRTRVKSLEGIDYCLVEESENVTLEIVKNLHDTIRGKTSDGKTRKIIYIYNPYDEDNALEKYYKNSNQVLRIHMNYLDNPFCPQDIIDKAEEVKEEDYEEYEHVYLGGYKKVSNEIIMGGKYRVEEFDTPDNAVFYHGIDWGFANSWTTCVRCFIDKDSYGNECIYIDHAYGGANIELGKETAELFDKIPTMRKWESIADSARPESISAMKNQGFKVSPTKKGTGSVEDGIKFLRSYHSLVIHPRCIDPKNGKKNILTDCKGYKYKKNPLTGEIVPIIIKENDDFLDAVRYSFEKVMRQRRIKHKTHFLIG